MIEPGMNVSAGPTIDEAVTQTCLQDGDVLVGWVVVADVLGVDGDRALVVQATDGMPDWVADGMLAGAPDILHQTEEDDD